MSPIEHLTFFNRPQLHDATLLFALSGWMDGGMVSTGTVKRMMDSRVITEVAQIDADPFYVFNAPGPMEVATLFRPEVKLADGMIVDAAKLPENTFHADVENNLAFFLGKEPNLKWQAFADSIFGVCREIGVRRIVFIGSFGGTVPHTRQPRMFGSISSPHLRPLLDDNGLRPSDYDGPSSFSTFLLAQAQRHELEMINLVAEIPGYLQGINPLSIEVVTRRLAKLLNVPVDLDALRHASNTWEARVSEAVEKDAELAQTIRKLEERYDNELIGVVTAEEGDGDETDDGDDDSDGE
jgi:proteasome assembly chaperone (PAC2) family protein